MINYTTLPKAERITQLKSLIELFSEWVEENRTPDRNTDIELEIENMQSELEELSPRLAFKKTQTKYIQDEFYIPIFGTTLEK